MIEVAKYTPARSSLGPLPPSPSTMAFARISDTPVFSRARDIGSMAAKRTIVSQLIVLYAASTLRMHPVIIIITAARSTAVTGATGMLSTTIRSIMAIIITAAMGALWSSVTLAASLRGSPRTTQLLDSFLKRAMSFHCPCTRSTSELCIFSSPRSCRR